ncbi:MAG: hypothetical protein ACR2MD_18180 [Aridibacter sp.]
MIKKFKQTTFAGFSLAFLFVFGLSLDVSAQGRSGQRGNSNPGSSSRPTSSPGVDRGINTAGDRSNGRSNDGLNSASRNSNGRSDSGIERARLQRENAQQADRELRRNPGIANGLRTNANDLREDYQNALTVNPNLKFGQFVAANMLSRNLSRRFPDVTTDAILQGLSDGNSIGGTLQDLGVSKAEAKEAKKRVERQMKENRRQD